MPRIRLWNKWSRALVFDDDGHPYRRAVSSPPIELSSAYVDAFNMRWECIGKRENIYLFKLLDNGEAKMEDWSYFCERDSSFCRSLIVYAPRGSNDFGIECHCGSIITYFGKKTSSLDYMCPFCRKDFDDKFS